MKCANCGNEMARGELFCKKCDVNTDEADLPQEKPKELVRRDKLCANAAVLFVWSGLSLFIAQIKDWHDFGIRIQDAYFVISLCFTAIMVFACLNMYHPLKLKRILKITVIVLAAEIVWQLYEIAALAVKTASESGAGVAVAVTAVILPVLIFSVLLLVYIAGILNVKSVLKIFLILMLLIGLGTLIIYFIGSAYVPDFKMDFFETITNFFNAIPETVALLIFIKLLPFVKSRFKKTTDAIV